MFVSSKRQGVAEFTNIEDIESEIHRDFDLFVKDFWDGKAQWDEVRYDDPRVTDKVISCAVKVLERWPQIDERIRLELASYIRDWMREAPENKLERMRIAERVNGALRIERIRPSSRDDSERKSIERHNNVGEQLAWAYILHRGSETGARALERAFEDAEGIIEPKEMGEFSSPLVELIVISAAIKACRGGDEAKISGLKEARTFGAALQRAREVLES